MEADVVHPVVFHRVENACPLFHIRRRIAGERKDTAIQDTAQMDVTAVQTDMMLALFHVAHSKDGRAYVLAVLRRKGGSQIIEGR